MSDNINLYSSNWSKTKKQEELMKAQEALAKMKAVEAQKLREQGTMQVYTGERGLKVFCRADSDKKKILTRDADYWADNPMGSQYEGLKNPRVRLTEEERKAQLRERVRRYNEKQRAKKAQKEQEQNN